MLAQPPVPSRLSVVACHGRVPLFALESSRFLKLSWDLSFAAFFSIHTKPTINILPGLFLVFPYCKTLCVDAEDPSHGKPALHASTTALG